MAEGRDENNVVDSGRGLVSSQVLPVVGSRGQLGVWEADGRPGRQIYPIGIESKKLGCPPTQAHEGACSTPYLGWPESNSL